MESEPLHHGEELLKKYCMTGELVDLRGHEDRTVRAEFLEWLLIARPLVDGPPVRAVRLQGAEITGTLRLTGAVVTFPLSFAECEFKGRPDLNDATLLSLSLVRSNMPGLTAVGVELRGTAELEGITSTGLIDLKRARIGGALLMRDCRLSAPPAEEGAEDDNRETLVASQAEIGGNTSLVRAQVTGQIRMIGARIGGMLNMRGTRLSNPGKCCLTAERIEVDEGIWFNKAQKTPAAVVEGRIVLDSAQVGGSIMFAGVVMTAPGPSLDPRLAGELVSLQIISAKIDKSLICGREFSAVGTVACISATVGQRLSFEGATIAGPDGGAVARLHLTHTRSETLNLNLAARPAWIDLGDAVTGVLIDRPDTWPATLSLDGFGYTRLKDAGSTPVAKRLEWLRLGGEDYLPQPYEQLIAAYVRSGHEQEAREVGFAKQAARAGSLHGLSRVWPAILGATVGYGYKTWRAAIWLGLLLAVGAAVFHWFGTPVATTDRPPPFQPIVYTIDLLVPVVEFGQEGAWRLHGGLSWMTWGYVAAGWILTTSIIAGLSRLLKRA